MEYVRQGDTSVTVPDGYIQKLVVGALHAALIENRPYIVEQSAVDMLYVFGNWDDRIAEMNAMVKAFGYEFVFAKDTITREGKKVQILYLSLVSLSEGDPDEAAV